MDLGRLDHAVADSTEWGARNADTLAAIPGTQLNVQGTVFETAVSIIIYAVCFRFTMHKRRAIGIVMGGLLRYQLQAMRQLATVGASQVPRSALKTPFRDGTLQDVAKQVLQPFSACSQDHEAVVTWAGSLVFWISVLKTLNYTRNAGSLAF